MLLRKCLGANRDRYGVGDLANAPTASQLFMEKVIMPCGTNGTSIAVNDNVIHVYMYDSEAVYSPAVVTAKGVADPQQHVSLHVIPNTGNPADEFDVSDSVHNSCASNGQWSCTNEFAQCGGGGSRAR